MRASPVDKSEPSKVERASLLRVLIWTAIGIALIVGLVLFFRYSRLITPTL